MGETKTLTVYKYTSILYNSTKQSINTHLYHTTAPKQSGSGPVKSVSYIHITNKHYLTNYNRVPLIPFTPLQKQSHASSHLSADLALPHIITRFVHQCKLHTSLTDRYLISHRYPYLVTYVFNPL